MFHLFGREPSKRSPKRVSRLEIEPLEDRCVPAITVQFDYSYDSNGFFNDPARRAALDNAASALVSRFQDNLSAITPGGSNQWTAIFAHPGTGQDQGIANLTVPANVVIVYAGGQDLPGSQLGEADAGYQVSGSAAFINSVAARGQAGGQGPAASQSDFGPWGGSLTFDSPQNWNFSVTNGPSAGQADFLSVAQHELAHLLGFGTASSWKNKVSGTGFTGTDAVQLYGGPVPVDAAGFNAGHWAPGTLWNGQPLCMNPVLGMGNRVLFKELDYAAMRDAGWQVSSLSPPPIANAGGPYTVGAGGLIQLAGTGSDPGGGSVSLAWDLDGDNLFGETGSAATRGTETGANPLFISAGLSVGTAATVRLRATAATGQSATSSGTVNITTPPYLIQGNQLTFTATGQNDGVFFLTAAVHQITLNAAIYQFNTATITNIQINGGGGYDSAGIQGGAGAERFEMTPDGGTLTGPGYVVTWNSLETLIATGDANDEAHLYDSPGVDLFSAFPTYSQMQGPGYFIQARSFGQQHGHATSTGADTAHLYDSPGDDLFVSHLSNAHMAGAGWLNQAIGFETVAALTSTGNDIAHFYDSALDDVFVAYPIDAYMTGGGAINLARGFDAVYAHANGGGGNDVAVLYDSAGNDVFGGHAGVSHLFGAGFFNQAIGFETVRAYATAGGADRTELYDSPGNDRFVSNQQYAHMVGPGFFNQAFYFEQVLAFANAGGVDGADLYDSALDDVFTAYADHANMAGAGYFNEAWGFETAHGLALYGGMDTANLYDSPGNDLFTGQGSDGTLSGPGYRNITSGFGRVRILSTLGGVDRKQVGAVNYLFDSIGPWLT